MKGLENSNLISQLCKISGTGQSCRARADNSNLHAVGLLRLFRNNAVFSGPVCHKALQLTNGDCLSLDAADTFSLTLALLWADTSAHSRKGAGLSDGLSCLLKLAVLYLRNKLWNIDGYRTSLDTFCILTVDAAGSFCLGFFLIISHTNFFKIGCSDLWLLLSYWYFL